MTSPTHLYRYRSLTQLDYVRQIVTDNMLYFTSPANFNDPFDCKPYMKLEGTSQELNRFFEGVAWNKFPNATPEGIRQIVDFEFGPHVDLRKVESKATAEWQKGFELGICCFTEPNDNVLMWSHYADCHRGICLQFRFEPHVCQASELSI